MRIFGFEIRRVKKIEYEEEEKFKKCVKSLMAMTEQIVESVSEVSYHVGEVDYMAMISNQAVFIHKQCDLYGRSKFSSPSSYLVMTNNMNQLRKGVIDLTNAMTKARMFDETVKQKADELGIPFQQLFFSDEMKPMVQEIKDLIDVCAENIKTYVINISTTLAGDYVKVMHDVDLIDDYRKQSKLKDDKDVKSYNISFKLMPKDKVLSKDKSVNKHS